jgi:hypothetical protein
MAGHRNDAIYREFLDLFVARLGGHPLYLTVVASACFYAYAALRRVELAVEALTAALLVLGFVMPDSTRLELFKVPAELPLLAAVLLQFLMGLWRRDAWRCLFAMQGLVAVAAILVPRDLLPSPLREAIFFHLAVLGVYVIATVFHDEAGRLLRGLAAALVVVACVVDLFALLDHPGTAPLWALLLYPLCMAALLAAYGRLLGHRPSVALAGAVVVCWLVRTSWWAYVALRQVVAGLDQIVLSMALFVVAVLISLGKSGLLTRRVVRDKQ